MWRDQTAFRFGKEPGGSAGPGLRGVVRGEAVRTTVSDKAVPCPLDRVNRDFKAPRPSVLWVADFTYAATWSGFVHVAFVVDAFARRIVGWRVSRMATAGFVLDALDDTLWAMLERWYPGLANDNQIDTVCAAAA